MKKLLLIAVVPMLAVTLLLTMGVNAQVKKGKERPLQTKNLMKGVVRANCGALKKALDAGPADDKAWAAVVLHAELLNECSHILMADGRCPDGAWAGAAKTLGGCSAVVLAKAEAKDVDGAKSAFGAMTKACGACHSKHKKKK
ncbi:MAG TPA: hypothetical protein QF564_30120 [Pirellulaceae bacterium]|nr:hypothetical protein [Pirellulaceae bacterium]